MAKKKSQIVKLSEEAEVKKIVVDTILGLWKIVNNLTRLRESKVKRYRVTIFGSSRAERGSFVYEQVKKISKELAEMDCDIISGGGPGLMQAANEGVKKTKSKSKSRSVGISIDLPFEQHVNPFVTQVYEHETFFTRLHHFVLTSDAFVIVPGGIGTTLEAMMIWQLLQVKHINDVPLIFAGKMWGDLLLWAKEHFITSDIALVNPEDLKIPEVVNTADEVIALLKKSHAKWKKK